MGASAGGGEVLEEILSRMPVDYSLPILIAQHLHPFDDGRFAHHLAGIIPLDVIVPCDKERIEPGRVYVAPANYHILVERDGTIALSVNEAVNWSRPSIDVLFDSAAYVWEEGLIAVILSGANNDGSEGMRTVKALGGLTIAQNPGTAEYPVMPQAAIEAARIETVLEPRGIADLLAELGASQMGSPEFGKPDAEREIG
jgi:two-component system chemotaxis response regulator CheB